MVGVYNVEMQWRACMDAKRDEPPAKKVQVDSFFCMDAAKRWLVDSASGSGGCNSMSLGPPDECLKIQTLRGAGKLAKRDELGECLAIQILSGLGKFWTWTRWGRQGHVGMDGQYQLVGYTNKDEAIEAFNKTVREKTSDERSSGVGAEEDAGGTYVITSGMAHSSVSRLFRSIEGMNTHIQVPFSPLGSRIAAQPELPCEVPLQLLDNMPSMATAVARQQLLATASVFTEPWLRGLQLHAQAQLILHGDFYKCNTCGLQAAKRNLGRLTKKHCLGFPYDETTSSLGHAQKLALTKCRELLDSNVPEQALHKQIEYMKSLFKIVAR